MEYVNVEGCVFAYPFIIEGAVGILDAKEKLQEKYRRKHSADIHFKRDVLGLYKVVLYDLQAEEDNSEQKIQVFIPALFVKVDLSEKVSKTKVGKAKEPGVACVSYRHIGVLKQIHISCKEEVYRKAYGHYNFIIMKLFEVD